MNTLMKTREDVETLVDLALNDYEGSAQHADTPILPDERAALRTMLIDFAEGNFTPNLLATLIRGVHHDADCRTAELDGYRKGVNEKIESVNHFDSIAEAMGG